MALQEKTKAGWCLLYTQV